MIFCGARAALLALPAPTDRPTSISDNHSVPHISFKDDEMNDDDYAEAHSDDSMLMLMTIAAAMMISVMNLRSLLNTRTCTNATDMQQCAACRYSPAPRGTAAERRLAVLNKLVPLPARNSVSGDDEA